MYESLPYRSPRPLVSIGGRALPDDVRIECGRIAGMPGIRAYAHDRTGPAIALASALWQGCLLGDAESLAERVLAEPYGDAECPALVEYVLAAL